MRDTGGSFKFSILVPAADYYPGARRGGEHTLQGVIDCWFERATDSRCGFQNLQRDRGKRHGTRGENPARSLLVRPALEEITGYWDREADFVVLCLNRAVNCEKGEKNCCIFSSGMVSFFLRFRQEPHPESERGEHT
jgi:hypothetical protein